MRYKSRGLLVLVMLFFTSQIDGQENNYSLNYEEFGVFFSPSNCVDSISFNLKGKYQGYKLKLFLQDCRGLASFELFDNKNQLRVSGNYDNAIDTLKKYRFGKYLGESEGVAKYTISVIKYLYPLKARQWVYYEGNSGQKRKRIVNYAYTTE